MSISSASRCSPRLQARPRYLCIASLIQRKNVLRLASAFERLGEGTLTFVGDGPLRVRSSKAGPGSSSSGEFPTTVFPPQIAAAHVVVQPSLIEPFGQAVLEAMACRPLGRRDEDRRPAGVRAA